MSRWTTSRRLDWAAGRTPGPAGPPAFALPSKSLGTWLGIVAGSGLSWNSRRSSRWMASISGLLRIVFPLSSSSASWLTVLPPSASSRAWLTGAAAVSLGMPPPEAGRRRALIAVAVAAAAGLVGVIAGGTLRSPEPAAPRLDRDPPTGAAARLGREGADPESGIRAMASFSPTCCSPSGALISVYSWIRIFSRSTSSAKVDFM